MSALQAYFAEAPFAKVSGALDQARLDHRHQALRNYRSVEVYAKTSVLFRDVADDLGGLAPLHMQGRQNDLVESRTGTDGGSWAFFQVSLLSTKWLPLSGGLKWGNCW